MVDSFNMSFRELDGICNLINTQMLHVGNTLAFQIPCEDRCLHPQTPPEDAFRGSNYLLTRYLEDFGRLRIYPYIALLKVAMFHLM